MGSFADGFGMGQRMVGDALDRQRQARLDEIAAAAAAQQQQLNQNRLEVENQALTDNKQIRASLAPADVNADAATVDYGDGSVHTYGMPGATDVANSDVRQSKRMAGTDSPQVATRAAAAGVAATPLPDASVDAAGANPEQAAEPAAATPVSAPAETSVANPKLGSTYAVNGTGFVDKAQGLAAAAKYNDPYERDQRYANTLYAQGKGLEAEQYLTAQHANRINATLNHFSEQLKNAGPQAAVEDFFSHGHFGFTAKVDMNPGGVGGVINQIDGKGNVIGKIPFADNADLYGQARAAADPAGVYANRMAQQIEQAKEQGKSVTTGPGSISTRVDSSGKTVVLADNRMTGFAPIFAPDGVTIIGYKRETERLGGGAAADAKTWHEAAYPSNKAETMLPDLEGKPAPNQGLTQLHAEIVTALKAKGEKDPLAAGAMAGKILYNIVQKAKQDVVTREAEIKSTGFMGTKPKPLDLQTAVDGQIAQYTKLMNQPPAKPSASPAAAATPAPAPQAAPARVPAQPAAPAVEATAAPKLDEATWIGRMKQEQAEMSAGKRMSYSPEVKAYVDQKTAEKRASDIAASQQERASQGAKQAALSKGYGFGLSYK